MFDDCTSVTKMNNNKSKEDYTICNNELDQKCFIAWSPLEKNKFSVKHKYVSCSRSVPHRSKRFVQYRISRSLNFDASSHSSSSENSSFEENKHFSRSAKIMRALNFNSSPSYYGKTKIKKSLNFNLTPSPKRFAPVTKSIRKSLSLNFNTPLSVCNKFLNFDDNPHDSANNSLLFSSSESIDENQNETPLQQSTKEHEMLHYSTPNTKLTKKSSCSASFAPLLRSQLKETIDNIVYVTTTPNSQSLKRVKGRSKCTNNIAMNTSRNLFHEFHEKDDDRPCTPENLICIIPESMSAIKRSHKKERSSRRSTNNFLNDENIFHNESKFQLRNRRGEHIDPLEDSKSGIDQYIIKNSTPKELTLSNSGDDMSDTGSLFNYIEEEDKLSDCASNYARVVSNVHKYDINVKSEENVEFFSEIQSLEENKLLEDHDNKNIYLTSDARSITPEPTTKVVLEMEKPVTPENRINILQRIANDSIKKSHKKTKDNNKKRLFSPKVVQDKLEDPEEQGNIKCWEKFKQDENTEENKVPIEKNYFEAPKEERSCTPDKVNSSRLLLSQFSSVKKSHKKDKHNKIVSGFLKRQEYFHKDMDLVTHNKYNKYKKFNVDGIPEFKNSTKDFSSDLDVITNIGDPTCSDKLSPSKRKKLLDISLDCETSSVSYDSELQESDVSKEEFKIFTPLKRKRSLIAPTVAKGKGKEYLPSYDLPSETNELSENVVADISFSRCLTPVLNFPSGCMKMEENDVMIIKSDCNVSSDSGGEIHNYGSCNDVTGRLTPRDMSTTELYLNLDSIKKSHKKNKRENGSRKGFNLVKNDGCVDGKSETRNTLELSNNCVVVNDTTNKSINDPNFTTDDDSEKNCASTSTENILSTVTPPNCLKTKNYIKLLRETSIKRSHKKVRDKKNQESSVDTNELSDDGSIFGDEEKLVFTED